MDQQERALRSIVIQWQVAGLGRLSVLSGSLSGSGQAVHMLRAE